MSYKVFDSIFYIFGNKDKKINISFLPYNLLRVFSTQRDIGEVVCAQLARSERHYKKKKKKKH